MSATRTAIVPVVAGLLLSGVALAVPAVAEPVEPAPDEVVFPGQEDVDEARQAEVVASAEVAQLDAAVAASEEELARAAITAASAVEDYNVAVVLLEERRAGAELAAQAAESAVGALESARTDLARIVGEAYRGANGLTSAAMLTSGDTRAITDRAVTLRRMGADRDALVQRVRAQEVVAEVLAEEAADALEAQEDAAVALEAARADAEAQRLASARVVEEQRAVQAQMLARLAELRATTVELEQQRQDGLAEQRRLRLEAEARARIEAEAAAERAAQEQAEQRARDQAAARAPEQRSQPQAAPAPARDTAPTRDAAPVRTPVQEPPAPRAPAPTRTQTPPPTAAPAPPSRSARSTAAQGEAAVAWARTQIGKRYQWGASGPDSYDCSGLSSVAWNNAGQWITRTSRSQYVATQRISYAELRPGDLVFWGTDPDDHNSIYHVAIYAGNGRVIEAPNSANPVREAPMRWTNVMPTAGRP